MYIIGVCMNVNSAMHSLRNSETYPTLTPNCSEVTFIGATDILYVQILKYFLCAFYCASSK